MRFVHHDFAACSWIEPPHTEVDGNRYTTVALDIGSGTGGVAQRYASLFDNIVATEVSMAFVWRLQRRGFQALWTEDPLQAGLLEVSTYTCGEACDHNNLRKYDVVFALNVVDRHRAPLQLLNDISQLVRNCGAIVLSVPLPISQLDSARWLPMLQQSPVPLNVNSDPSSWEDAASVGPVFHAHSKAVTYQHYTLRRILFKMSSSLLGCL